MRRIRRRRLPPHGQRSLAWPHAKRPEQAPRPSFRRSSNGVSSAAYPKARRPSLLPELDSGGDTDRPGRSDVEALARSATALTVERQQGILVEQIVDVDRDLQA